MSPNLLSAVRLALLASTVVVPAAASGAPPTGVSPPKQAQAIDLTTSTNAASARVDAFATSTPAAARARSALPTYIRSLPSKGDAVLAKVDRAQLDRDHATWREQVKAAIASKGALPSPDAARTKWLATIQSARDTSGVKTVLTPNVTIGPKDCVSRDCARDGDMAYRLLSATGASRASVTSQGSFTFSGLASEGAAQPSGSAQSARAPFAVFVLPRGGGSVDAGSGEFRLAQEVESSIGDDRRWLKAGTWFELPAGHDGVVARADVSVDFSYVHFLVAGYASTGYSVRTMIYGDEPGSSPLCTNEYVEGVYVPVAGAGADRNRRSVSVSCPVSRAPGASRRVFVSAVVELWSVFAGFGSMATVVSGTVTSLGVSSSPRLVTVR